MEIEWGAVRVRATSYVTRVLNGEPQLLVFDYPALPEVGFSLPGGGIEPGERPDSAAIREVVEETGVSPELEAAGLVGVQQCLYDNGAPCISLYFHLLSNDERDSWSHRMIGDPQAWDTGLEVRVRFEPLPRAAQLLRAASYQQEEFVDLLRFGAVIGGG